MRWAAGVLLALAFLLFAAANAAAFVCGLRKQRSSMSYIPLVGGLAGVLGLFALPISLPRGVKLAPLVLDIGCLPMLIGMLIDLTNRRRDP